MSGPATATSEVIWHDVECGSYEADLPLWRELSSGSRRRSVLELGCGTGRVALALARSGLRVAGIDNHPALVAELNRRAAECGLDATAAEGDIRKPGDGRGDRDLVLAPMQLIQLLDGARERALALVRMHDELAPGGLAAIALVEGDPTASDHVAPGPPLPDVAERDGWIYSSLPLDSEVYDGAIRVRRLRQTVSPDGVLTDEVNVIRLAITSANEIEREAERVGLSAVGRRDVPVTDAHVGSTVVLLEKSPR